MYAVIFYGGIKDDIFCSLYWFVIDVHAALPPTHYAELVGATQIVTKRDYRIHIFFQIQIKPHLLYLFWEMWGRVNAQSTSFTNSTGDLRDELCSIIRTILSRFTHVFIQ